MNKAFKAALRSIFTDPGLVIFLILVPLFYPLLYAFIYTGETVREVPVVVVDEAPSTRSRDFIRRLDATPDVRIVAHAVSITEAERYIRQRKAYGVLQLPSDFTDRLMRQEQSRVGVFVDMSGMLYYKAILSAATDVSLDMNAEIKVERAGNITQREDATTERALRYEQVALFNPQSGFASFLIPAVLIILLQQTLLLGIGMEAGTARERWWHQTRAEGRDPLAPLSLPPHAGRRALRQLLGRSMAFFTIYMPVTCYCLLVVPHMFRLPQIGRPSEVLLFVVPFLLASVFFGITVSALPRRRESIILLVVFSSIPMLFLTGVSWPGSAFPWYWELVSYTVPSTFGVNGFVRLSTMGADLRAVSPEYLCLWLQTLVYGGIAWWATRLRLARDYSLTSAVPEQVRPSSSTTI